VIGVSSPERILELARLREEVIPDQFWDELAALGPAPSPIQDPAVR
jgi:D-threo-aldose 1-dehydrogenase